MTPSTITRQAPLSVEFSREEHWSGLPFPSPEYLLGPRIKPGSPALQVYPFLSEPTGNPSHSGSAEPCLSLCDPMDCSPSGFSVHGENPGLGCHAFLQGIFPTQGSNSGLLHCRWICYHLSHRSSLSMLLICMFKE